MIQPAVPTTDPAGQAPSVTPPVTAPDPTPAPPDANKTPDWYEKELTKTRNEAASYRTRLRDAETKLTSAKSQEDIDAALTEMRTANAKLERDLLVATVGANLPSELRELLKGDNEAELKAHAEVLKKFIPAGPTPPTSLAGGLDPSKTPDAFDPEDFATKWRSGAIPRASISGRNQ